VTLVPDGAPEAESDIALLNPLLIVVVMVDILLDPCATVT
jgi:hypothetical protein